MTIQELVYKCGDITGKVCGTGCPYAKECKQFKAVINASVIPQALLPIIKHLSKGFLETEV